jgi:hypothetical protein
MKLAKTQKEKWREPNTQYTETSKILKFPQKKQQKKGNPNTQ